MCFRLGIRKVMGVLMLRMSTWGLNRENSSRAKDV
jgi:hypothetical protein